MPLISIERIADSQPQPLASAGAVLTTTRSTAMRPALLVKQPSPPKLARHSASPGLRALEPDEIARRRAAVETVTQQKLRLVEFTGSQVGLHERVFKYFALCIGTADADDFAAQRLECAPRRLILSTGKRRNSLHQGQHEA